MPPLTRTDSGRAYWRSLDELSGTPQFREFVEKEFPNFAPELLSSPSRRQFLKVMGASLALAGLAGCRWPREEIVPYARRPRNRAPGVPVQYATAFEQHGVGTGLLVTSYDGRPIKVEGLPDHPFSRGATDGAMQAAILEIYDPDRSRQVVQRDGVRTQGANAGTRRSWADFDAFADAHFRSLAEKRGAGLCILSEASDSPTLADLRARLNHVMPQVRWFEYEPVSWDSERAGIALANGAPQRRQFRSSDENGISAEVIVCLDSDLLMQHPTAIRNTREFAAGRTAENGRMNRLYVVESDYTITGGVADHRFPARTCDIPLVICRLAAELVEHGLALPRGADAIAAALHRLTSKIETPFVKQIAKDLLDHRGKVLIHVGPGQPPEAHALAHLINQALGGPFEYTVDPWPERKAHGDALAELAQAIDAAEVDTLVLLGTNPAYTAPVDLKFAERLAKVPTSIHLSLYDDETSLCCAWHVPRAHFLESWGDVRAYDGTVSIVQPLIAPLYDGRTPIELLAQMAGEPVRAGYELVRQTYRERFFKSGNFDAAWNEVLYAGLIDSRYGTAPEPSASDWGWIDRLVESAGKIAPAAAGEFEVTFRPDYKVLDGRYANNGWLQELPDPITKLTWDNAALISVADAHGLGVKRDDFVKIEVGGRALELPVCVVPGHARGSVTLPLGYGRVQAGLVAAGDDGDGVGKNTYLLRTQAGQRCLTGATLTRVGRSRALAVTQDHHAITSEVGDESARERMPRIVREADLEHYKEHPEFAQHVVHLPILQSLFPEKSYDEGYRWGMAIDLTKCTGCSACVVACQAENNIPVVGRDEVNMGREMHWLRIDRYFTGEPDAPEIVHQPMPCQHCENAPCEQVCPVGATMHSDEGLNDQVYNRCIGTRYCANNCPYKVRRFNWFYNHHGPSHPRSKLAGKPLHVYFPGSPDQAMVTKVEEMAFNPDVTVRSRGVMEKCTFCVQRIQEAKINTKNAGTTIHDGMFTTACAQACPADAIVFGDLNDPNSRVRRLHAHNRAYALLAELNVQPRNQYLAKLRNPVPGGHGENGHGGAGHGGGGHHG